MLGARELGQLEAILCAFFTLHFPRDGYLSTGNSCSSTVVVHKAFIHRHDKLINVHA